MSTIIKPQEAQEEITRLLNSLPLFKETEIYLTERDGAIVALEAIINLSKTIQPVEEKRSRLNIAVILGDAKETTFKTIKCAQEILGIIENPANEMFKKTFIEQMTNKKNQLIAEKATEKIASIKETVDSIPANAATHNSSEEKFEQFHTECNKLHELIKNQLIPANKYDFTSGIYKNSSIVSNSFWSVQAVESNCLELIKTFDLKNLTKFSQSLKLFLPILDTTSQKLLKLKENFTENKNLWAITLEMQESKSATNLVLANVNADILLESVVENENQFKTIISNLKKELLILKPKAQL